MDRDSVCSGIILEEIAFAYDAHKIFECLNLSIPKGEIWALVGRSGSGKTTLLQIIAGLYRPRNGRIRVAGREGLSEGRVRGMVFQDEALLGWLTAEENVLFPKHRHPTMADETSANSLLESVGLLDHRTRYPYQLSAGMRKRVEFARALFADSEYILADEPFGTVDVLTRRDLWQLWIRLRGSQPRTGILCTHDPEEAVRLCDAVVTLSYSLPSRLTVPLRIPGAIKQLDVGEENDEVWSIKKQIISELGGTVHEIGR